MPALDPARLRLIVITDARQAAPANLVHVVRRALAAGAPAVQLREKERGVGEILHLGRRLRHLTREAGALLFVNDRVDLALALEADGAHLGPEDLPVGPVRNAVPPGFLLGFSTDRPEAARRAVGEGADYIGCGTVFPTGSKGNAGKVIGPEGLRAVVRAVRVPVVGIGGITPQRASAVAATGAVGTAVIGAVMGVDDPARAVRALLGPFAGGRS